MELDALIRSICLRDRYYMFLLGAGTSITSGIPSAEDCVWDWKLQLYLTQNSHISPTLFGNASSPFVRQRVQKWLDQQKTHPPLNSDEEYGYFIEKCFPRDIDRQDEFKRLGKKGNPHIGYKLLGLLLEFGKIKWVWTTNFDDLVERGRPPDRKRLFLQIGMDSTDRLNNVRIDGEEIIQAFLHGDYRYDQLKNTNEEVQNLDSKYLKKLIDLSEEHPLVIVGYSGRDRSVMDALTKAYSVKGKAGLFWCCMENSSISAKITHLIETAKSVGNTAEIVPYNGFDDFLIRLARFWLKDSPEHIFVEDIYNSQPIEKGFEISSLSPDFNWIISNAYKIELPCELFQFSLKDLPEKGAWKKLKEWIGDHPISAGLFKGKVLAMGTLEGIKNVFQSHLSSKIEQISFLDDNLSISNSVIYEVLLKGFVKSLENENLRKIGKYELASLEEKLHNYKNTQFKYFETINLFFNVIAGKTYLLMVPDIKLLDEKLSSEDIKSVKRDILWRQRNKEFMQTIKTWRQFIFSNGDKWRFVYPPGEKTGFEFKVDPNGPIFTRIYSNKPKSAYGNLAKKLSRFETFKAFTVDEPFLQFRTGEDIKFPSKSIHPIKGLIDCGGPIEKNDVTTLSSEKIRLGVICMAGHEGVLKTFLNTLKDKIAVGYSEDKDYIIDFPGFEEVFKCGLSIPSNSYDSEWKTISPISHNDPISMNKKATQIVTEKIKELEASTAVDVVLIYIPNGWSSFEKIITDDVHLDLHDQIKAFCVERGIRSQLIRENKVRNENNCRMRWWLSLAIFTKSMRTPWMLESLGANTAYVGIGYSIDEASKGNPIVLGCSHVFDATGVGMRFKLSKLQNPIWQQDAYTNRKNPYMSRDDAYLLGVRTRQLFYESHHNLPERVMVCKRTPFIKSEIEGVLSALSEIKHVDLLTIQRETAWRYCAYDTSRELAHLFPVKRGTGLILDKTNMLLWLHGNVVDLANNRNYFQGKSRIPTPIRVTRYSGDTPVQIVANDLLALTKMDWNTFALYKQLPVTVTTPNSIAKIGRLLHNTLSAESYDYRLFM